MPQTIGQMYLTCAWLEAIFYGMSFIAGPLVSKLVLRCQVRDHLAYFAAEVQLMHVQAVCCLDSVSRS